MPTVALSCALLGVALIMRPGITSRLIDDSALSAPALAGILLLTAAVLTALALVVTVRRRRDC